VAEQALEETLVGRASLQLIVVEEARHYTVLLQSIFC